MFCPYCLSDEITQLSDEAVEYDCKAGEIISVSFNSPHQEYECRDCEETFDSKEAKEITIQVESVWKYLCEKHGWSDQDKKYMADLLKSISDRESWSELFHAIWREKVGEGYMEWEWCVSFNACVFDVKSEGAVDFVRNNMDELDFNKVRWTPNWTWTDTK